MIAVVDDIGEMTDPVAKDDHPCLFGQLQIQFDMPMPEDKIVNVWMSFQITLGIKNQIFLILTFIVFLFPIGLFQSALFGPRQSQIHSPTRVDSCKQSLADLIVEDCSQKTELDILIPQAITMSQIE